jgi:hypothetical protein
MSGPSKESYETSIVKNKPVSNMTRFTFIRDHRNNAPVGCIAYRVNNETRRFEYEISTHNPKDNFDRKLARAVAVGRLDRHPRVITFDENSAPPSLPQLLRSAAISMIDEHKIAGHPVEGVRTHNGLSERLVKALATHVKYEDSKIKHSSPGV